MPLVDPQGNNGAQADQSRKPPSNQTPNRRVLSIERWNRASEMHLEEMLSSGLLASDSELAHILQAVDEISKTLKSGAPDEQTLRIAHHPAVWTAVKQTLLDRELRHLALTDDLTCVYNRRGFFAAATQLLKLAHRNAQHLLLFFCDVNNLKKINDSFGHREGDLTLIRAADALEQTFRDSDILARIGGDEFAVLAVVASGQRTETILRRLEKYLKMSSASEKRYELSLSVGVARFDPKRAVSLGELMSQADQAMYEQKPSRSSSFSSKPKTGTTPSGPENISCLSMPRTGTTRSGPENIAVLEEV
jgi:diguanylate cyclase (GGDEF)-like protein